ncbi:MAG: hypothetical protein V4685_17290 [Bacteroidota bacterium]
MKRLKVLCIILLAFTGNMYAAPIVSGNSGDWNNPSTWVGGVSPVAGDVVTIANGHIVTITANAACASVIIGNGVLNQNSTLTINAGISLIVSANITITAPLSGTVDNTLDVTDGIVSCASLITSNSLNDIQRCIVHINTGKLTCTGGFVMANNIARNKLIFSGAGLLQVANNSSTISNAQFTSSTGTVEYSGTGGQIVLPLSYHTLKCSGAGYKYLGGNIILTGDLIITGTAQLDASNSGNYSIALAGNWTVTSTSSNPFVERSGTVTLNGSAGVQVLSTPLSRETFYNLIINNTAANTGADIKFTKNCGVTQAYTHISGTLDLMGKRLEIASNNRLGVFTDCTLSGGSIISSVAGSAISIVDSYDSTFVNFTGTKVGNSSIPVTLSVNTGRINLENLTLYGTGSFTKRHSFDDVASKGGNKFYNTVTFIANAPAGNWWFGTGNGAQPDSFFAKAAFHTFSTSAASKLILGANTTGNYYGDDVTFNVRSAGNILIGNNSGAANGTSSSTHFNKQVDVLLTGAGNITFAEGSSLLPAAVIFNKIIKLNSASGSTGSIYIGKNVSGSSISLTGTAQLTNGYLYGSTSIYLYNITQTGSLVQTLSNTNTTGNKIIVGSIISPCTWNGPVTFTGATLDLAYNIFNGNSNIFALSNSSGVENCTGGNTFAAGTSTYFTNYTPSDWYFATTAADDYNGDVYYRMNSAGTLYPAYNSNCTYAGNIVILPGSDTVIFASSANGRVTLDGNTNNFFINNSTKPSSIKRLTINKASNTFGLHSHWYMPAGGNLTLSSGKIGTLSTGMLILQDETCTVTATTAASTSYIDGPIRIDVSTSSPVSLHFPIGKNTEARPIDLTIQHTSSTSYSYTAESVQGSANALGWAYPTSVTGVSLYRWWDITRTVTSSGAAAPTTDLVTSPLPVVSLYYGLNDRAPNPIDVTIVKNTYNALTSWIDIGATGATNTIGKVTCTSTPSAFNSFSRFTLGFYGRPQPPVGRDSSRCGTGSAVITATPVNGEYVDWYANPTGGTALATNTTTFNTPVISSTTTYYAEARNTRGYVSTTRTAVTATIYNTPTISTFSPTVGESGTTVVITGTDFNNNISSVTFGGTAALSFTVNSSTQITAVVGGGASGSVAVTNDCGTGSRTGFVYNPLTVWTGAMNTTWTNAANWDDGVPTIIHSAIIPNVTNQPLISSNQSIKSITIQAGAEVDIAVGNSLNIKDSLTNNGDVIGSGSITLNGTATQPIRGIGNYSNLALNNSTGAFIAGGAGNMVNITGRYTPTAGVLTTNNNLTIKSSVSSTANIAAGPAAGGYISGKVTLERQVPARRAWRLINFPVTSAAIPDLNTALQEGAGGNASLNSNPGYGTHITGGAIADGFDQNPSNNPSVKEWVGGAWQAIASTNTPINTQLPYFVFVRGSRANDLGQGASATPDNTVLRLTANIKQGNQSLSVAGSGWQLTGNPFPSVINLDAVAVNNSSTINRNFVFWDPKLGGGNNVGGFVTASYNGAGYDYSPAPSSSLSEYAQSFAGFYVDATGAGTITIAESNKCNCNNGNVFRPISSFGTTGKLHINLHSVNADGSTPVVDGTMTAFDNKYSSSADSYDATKLPNTLSENISIAKEQTRYSIERRNTIADNDTVFLNISNMRVKNYQLEITTENFDTTIAAYLEDSYTAERKPLSLATGVTYSFSIINNPAAYAPGRFRIVFEKDRIAVMARKNKTVNNAGVNKGSIKLLQNPVANNTLQLGMNKQQKGNYSISIVNSEGKAIAVKQFNHDGSDAVKIITINQSLPKGSLVATIKNEQGNVTSFNIIAQ